MRANDWFDNWLIDYPVWAGWVCGLVSGLGFALILRGLFG